jgi:diaminopimelate decarboxylase
VDAKTHPYISTGLKENKFGININAAAAVYQRAAELPHINPVGIDCHIGSQLTELEPFLAALDRVLALAERLQASGIKIRHLDLGGGLGIPYQDENPPQPADYAAAVLDRLRDTHYQILLEPGRAIMGNAGVLLTRVEYLKSNGEHHFAIVDAAMNDNMRPALYQAWQEIVPVDANAQGIDATYNIVGPICETGDFLGKDRKLSLKAGDLLAMRSSGAYGFSMSSQYNTRPRAAEIMVDGDKTYVIRPRETVDQLMAGEVLLPEG